MDTRDREAGEWGQERGMSLGTVQPVISVCSIFHIQFLSEANINL